MRHYKQVLPMWALYFWIPVNIYLVYKIVAATKGAAGDISYALPVVFVVGFVSSAFTFLFIDIAIWYYVVKPKESAQSEILTEQQKIDYQYNMHSNHDHTSIPNKNKREDFFEPDNLKQYSTNKDIRDNYKNKSSTNLKSRIRLIMIVLGFAYLVLFLYLNRHIFSALWNI